MSEDPMVEEFDTVATWTADAVAELGDDHALPAACRGSGSPAALDWLASRLGLERGTRLLDSGAGVGGPAEQVARTHGVVPTLVEPMEGACRAAASLFGHRVVVGDGAALPFPDGSFDASWSLGVLCTVDDKERHVAELVRVVGDGGAVGLLVFVRTVDELPQQPEGNSFPDHDELVDLVRSAGLEILDEAHVSDLPASPETWQQAVAEVEEVIERDHGDEEGFRVAQRNQERIVGLISDGLVVGRLLACRVRPGAARWGS
jgi:SAM-dependent methyltransferase